MPELETALEAACSVSVELATRHWKMVFEAFP
jgi:hypothetical protein